MAFPGSNVQILRDGPRVYYLTPGVTLGSVREALTAEGEVLKRAPKSETRRVDGWVVKTRTGPAVDRALKLTALRARYRRVWNAARFLNDRGVHVPKARAYVEDRALGIIWGSVCITDFLDNCVNVEAYVRQMQEQGAGEEEFAGFLARLAQAVERLTTAPAHHGDLSGKNILTPDGFRFYFIDLDSCRPGVRPKAAHRLLNHVQLYDSFCDYLDDALLEPFIESLAALSTGERDWFSLVKNEQINRRQRHLDRNHSPGQS